MQIRGFQVAIGGTYVLMDDVVTALRAYAQSLTSPDAGAVVHELASWLAQGAPEIEEALPDDPMEVELAEAQVYGAEPLDESSDIERIEIYPDPPDDPRPKWYARSVDTGGYIVQTTGGSFDQDWVIQNASERWPGKGIFLLSHAGGDSKWEEDRERGVFPSKGPPVRRLWAGAGR